MYNFVGCVFNRDKVLVIFPKHYAEPKYIERLNKTNEESKKDIQLVYDVIKKYSENVSSNASAQKYIGADDRYDSDYPFSAFYNIYDYYKRYGLYKETESTTIKGNSGKVAWKDTIRKSNKIISDGNLIFITLYVKKKNFKNVFVSDCMAFVIDSTIERFNSFLTLRGTGASRSKFDYFENIDFVIGELRKAQTSVFKDIHKKLIQDLISFFEQYKKGNSHGGATHVKIDYFDLVWQDMVSKFLNNHFVGMNYSSVGLKFDKTICKSPINFESVQYSDIDASIHSFSINVDHIANTGTELYIFDSKYYDEIYELNYKQLAYNEILRYRYASIPEENIYNALILPGKECCKVHFEMTPFYAGPRKNKSKILEQYLDIKEIMEDYVS